MSPSRRIPLLAPLVALLLAGGTVHAQQPIALSVPDGKPEGAKSTIYPDGMLKIRIGKSELWIQVQNFPNNDLNRSHKAPGGWWRQPPMMPMPEQFLRVWMTVMPRQERVEIDLREVYLFTQDGVRLAPAGFQGPGIGKTEDSTDPFYGCGDPPAGLKPKKLLAPPTKGINWEYQRCYNCPRAIAPFQELGEPIRVEVPACFVVRYEVSNSPELPFRLSVSGLKLDGRPAGIGSIPFRMGRIDHFPSTAHPVPVQPGAPGRGP